MRSPMLLDRFCSQKLHCESLWVKQEKKPLGMTSLSFTFAMESVCCSITSCRTDLVLSFILSNSSMQQMPLSLSTRAPVWRTSCRVSGSFITYAVRPTALEPLPEVYWPRGTRLYTYWSSWDLLVPGSPQRRMLISERKFPLPVWVKSFLDPPKSWSRIPYKKENITSCIDVTEQI